MLTALDEPSAATIFITSRENNQWGEKIEVIGVTLLECDFAALYATESLLKWFDDTKTTQ